MNTEHKHIREIAKEMYDNTPPNPITIENSNPKLCKFPLDNEQDIADSNTLFCGKPRFDNFSYCKWHFIITHDTKK